MAPGRVGGFGITGSTHAGHPQLVVVGPRAEEELPVRRPGGHVEGARVHKQAAACREVGGGGGEVFGYLRS